MVSITPKSLLDVKQYDNLLYKSQLVEEKWYLDYAITESKMMIPKLLPKRAVMKKAYLALFCFNLIATQTYTAEQQTHATEQQEHPTEEPNLGQKQNNHHNKTHSWPEEEEEAKVQQEKEKTQPKQPKPRSLSLDSWTNLSCWQDWDQLPSSNRRNSDSNSSSSNKTRSFFEILADLKKGCRDRCKESGD